MANFIINTNVRDERVAKLEQSVRKGTPVTLGERTLTYRERFHIDGKRVNLNDAREMLAEGVESDMYLEFEAEQAKIAQNAADEAARAQLSERAIEVEQFVENFGENMKVADVAKLLQLSEVRVRRMVTENKLEYGERGTVKTLGVVAELERRARVEAQREADKVAKANAKRAQKTGEATDAE